MMKNTDFSLAQIVARLKLPELTNDSLRYDHVYRTPFTSFLLRLQIELERYTKS